MAQSAVVRDNRGLEIGRMRPTCVKLLPHSAGSQGLLCVNAAAREACLAEASASCLSDTSGTLIKEPVLVPDGLEGEDVRERAVVGRRSVRRSRSSTALALLMGVSGAVRLEWWASGNERAGCRMTGFSKS